MANYYDEAKGWIIDGQSLEEFENAHKPVTDEELKELGIIEEPKTPDEGDGEDNLLKQIDKFMDYETRPTGAKYKKLSLWDTAVDTAKAIGNEALHLVQPKSMETQYIERTHFAENLKYMYRYGAGTLGFGKIGALLKGVQGTSKGVKALNLTGKILSPDMVKTNNKLVKTLSAGLDNLGAGALAAFTLRNPEEMEGQIADIFGETDNPIIKALQTNPNDSELQERLKGTVQDTLAGIVAAPILHSVLSPVLGKLEQGVSKLWKNRASAEASEQALKEVEVK